jgi:hypothetical protein
VNAKRIASLLRHIGSLQIELADAFEQVDEPKKRKAPKLEAPTTEPDKATLEEARRALKKAGFAA